MQNDKKFRFNVNNKVISKIIVDRVQMFVGKNKVLLIIVNGNEKQPQDESQL